MNKYKKNYYPVGTPDSYMEYMEECLKDKNKLENLNKQSIADNNPENQKLPSFSRLRLYKDILPFQLNLFVISLEQGFRIDLNDDETIKQGKNTICELMNKDTPTAMVRISIIEKNNLWSHGFNQRTLSSGSYAYYGQMFTIHRWWLLGENTFRLTDTLNEQLQYSDIGKKCPIEFFKLPYNNIYIEFGTKRDSMFCIPYTKAHGSTSTINKKWLPIEGVYLHESKISLENLKKLSCLEAFVNAEKSHKLVKLDLKCLDADTRILEITFIGSPIGNNDILDDGFHQLIIVIQPTKHKKVEDIIEDQFETFYYGNEEKKEKITEALLNLVKAILYINSTTTQRKHIKNTLKLQQVINRSRNNKAKYKKLLKTKYKEYDYILLGDEDSPSSESISDNEDPKTMSTHWRRGHFRHQRFCENNLKEKLIFIKPTLINPDGSQPKTKTYKLK